jgi:hypothetical protein
MTIARISELDRRTTQSGKANAGRWQLEFERSEPQRADPLTGSSPGLWQRLTRMSPSSRHRA